MAELHVFGKDGTPRGRHLFAVFQDGDAAGQAEQELAALGLQFMHLCGTGHALAMKRCAEHALLGKVERFLKNIGGESHEAQRYARHLDDGDVVVALPVRDRTVAVSVTRTLTGYGAYDVTYYTGWTIEHTSWEADSARGLPTYTTTNAEAGPLPVVGRFAHRHRPH